MKLDFQLSRRDARWIYIILATCLCCLAGCSGSGLRAYRQSSVARFAGEYTGTFSGQSDNPNPIALSGTLTVFVPGDGSITGSTSASSVPIYIPAGALIGEVNTSGQVTMRHGARRIFFSGTIANSSPQRVTGTWIIPSDVDSEASGVFEVTLKPGT